MLRTQYSVLSTQKPACGILCLFHQFMWRAREEQAAPFGSTFWSEVDEPIAGAKHVQIVLDDQHGVAPRNKSLEHADELPHVGGMQTGSRFVEDIERAARFGSG